MGVTITYGGTLPSLNDPATFNDRALSLFSWLTGSGASDLLGQLADMDAAGFFNVQDSVTDAELGKVMTVGAFGLGLGASSNLDLTSDLNAVRVTGWYRYDSSTTGKPPPSAGVVQHICRLTGADLYRHYQLSFAGTVGDLLHYRIMLASGTWSPWYTVYASNSVISTVSQSGGVPTGGLIERGSNANGNYVRFADGTQFCDHRVSASLDISVAYLGGFRTAGQSWTFPAVFSAAPRVVAMPEQASGFGAASHSTPTTTTGNWVVTSVTSQGAATRQVSLIAIGRWY